MTMRHSSLLNQVYAARAGAIAQPAYRAEPRSAWPQFYFQLNLLPQPTPDDQLRNATPPLVTTFAAGVTYTMQVLADPDEDGRTTLRPVTLQSDLELSLTSSHRGVQIEPPIRLVPRDLVGNAPPAAFQVTVAPNYLGDAVTLTLGYRRAGTATNPIVIAQYDLHGHGVEPAPPMPTRHIALDARLRDQVRVLHVELTSPTLYHIYSYWDEETNLDTEILHPGVSPARFMRKRDLPQAIINKIQAKSANNPIAFIKWLKTNLRAYGQDFCLIVHDDSDQSDMAWELIHIYLQPDEFPKLPTDLTGQVPIGALVTVTHWVPGLHWYDIEHELTIAEATTGGQVVAYLDHDQTLAHAQDELAALTPFALENYGDIASFKLRLGGDIAGTGLIYIGSHGIIVNEAAEKDFILQLNQDEQINVYDLTALPYLANIATRPIVLVNACHSAWLFRHEGIRYGLPVALLQHIAKDFIGTIGPVGDKCAAAIAAALFQAVHTTASGARLASVLRDLRANAFRQLRHAQPNDEHWFDYLYTFMYVYYGNPFSRLQLSLAPAAKQEGESS